MVLKTPKQMMMDVARGIDQTAANIRNAGASMLSSTGLPAFPAPPAPPSLEQLVAGIPEPPMPTIGSTAQRVRSSQRPAPPRENKIALV